MTLNIEWYLGTTYYISNKGKQCLQILLEIAKYQGISCRFQGGAIVLIV